MPVSYVSMMTEAAIAKYKANSESYIRHEAVKVDQYRESYKHIKGSLADQIVERAIWYMEHGYTVYGSGRNSYRFCGVVDCSGFTKLVYGDFGFHLTGVSKKYDQVGTAIPGVYQKNEYGLYRLRGLENVRPGDIFTWWKARPGGKRYIGHVAIYMGRLNGKPAVIGTSKGAPTAIGIITGFKRWYGEHFHTARRILPEGSWTPGQTMDGHADQGPVIPKRYVLPPQKPIIMPAAPYP